MEFKTKVIELLENSKPEVGQWPYTANSDGDDVDADDDADVDADVDVDVDVDVEVDVDVDVDVAVDVDVDVDVEVGGKNLAKSSVFHRFHAVSGLRSARSEA